MPNSCLVTTLPYPAPAGFAGPVYQTPEATILARASIRFWGDGTTAAVAGTLGSRGGLAAGYTQATAANRPTFTANGDPAVIGGAAFLAFDGTAVGAGLRDFMMPNGSLADLNPADPYTVIDVVRPDNLPAQTEFLWGSNALATSNDNCGCFIGTTGISYTQGNATGRLLQPVTAGEWIAVACGFNGTRHTLVTNGVRQIGTPTSTPAANIKITLGTRPEGGAEIGRFTGAHAMRMIFIGEDVTDNATFWAVLRNYVQGYFGFAADPLAA